MREENFTDQNSLSVSSLYTDYLNLDRRSGCGKNSERENIVHKKCTFCGSAINYAKLFSKVSESKSKNLVRMMIWTTNVQNACLKKM